MVCNQEKIKTMDYVLTTFIQPLENKIPLSEKKKLFLDNPRTNEEIQELFEIINASYNNVPEAYSYGDMRFPPEHENKDIITIELAINEFLDSLPQTKFLRDFKANLIEKDSLQNLARMWVVIRYEADESHSQPSSKLIINTKYLFDNESVTKELNWFDGTHIRFKKFEEAYHYSAFLSHLIVPDQDEYYYGDLIVPYEQDFYQFHHINRDLNRNIAYFCLSLPKGYPKYSPPWQYQLPISLENIKIWTNKIEAIIDEEYDTIMYIGSLLANVRNKINDDKQKLVSLVGVIELLLTHNPDFNRFNVEDSISKQFKLKTSILLYKNDETIDLNETKKLLTIIYSQRSNIAHGNFQAIKKYISSLGKYDDGDEKGFDILVSEVYRILRVVLKEYIKAPKYIHFLKDN